MTLVKNESEPTLNSSQVKSSPSPHSSQVKSSPVRAHTQVKSSQVKSEPTLTLRHSGQMTVDLKYPSKRSAT